MFIAALSAIGAAVLATIVGPNGAFALASSVVVSSLVLWSRLELRTLFLAIHAVLLLGYMFLGRGFAYVGLAPVYVGEIVLALGLIATVAQGRRLGWIRQPGVVMILLFVFWGGLRTLPYIPQYGVDALRDSVVWAYGLFAVALVAVARRPEILNGWVRHYTTLVPWSLLWFAAFGFAARAIIGAVPLESGPGVPLLGLKSGDMGVHLAGIAAFMLLGLHHAGATRTRQYLPLIVHNMLLWSVWFVAFVGVAISNRGGTLAALTGLVIVGIFRPLTHRWRAVLLALAVAAPFAILARPAPGEPTYVDSVLTRVESIVLVAAGQSDEAFRSGTALWRTNWWTDIINYTVFGPYRLTGKGYGVNLADDDGYQVESDGALRSPHNGHITILARSGVPGFALWATLQFFLLLNLSTAQHRLRLAGQVRAANLAVWLLAYLAASNVNIAFDVYLEGPQGGIWHWSLTGLAIAALGTFRPRSGISEEPDCVSGAASAA